MRKPSPARAFLTGVLLLCASVVVAIVPSALSPAAPASASAVPLSITTTSLPQAVECILFVNCPQLFYSAPLAATGGTPGYTWSLASGTLPSGVSVQPQGAVAGQISTTGSFPFTVRVTDAAGTTVQAGFTLVVTSPNAATSPLSITTTSLPHAEECILFVACPQMTYTTQLTAAGGKPGYTWSLVTGTLPGGVTLQPTGTIAGQVSSTGSFTFTVKVTDAAGATAQATFTLVATLPVRIVTTSLPPAVECILFVACPQPFYSAPLTATGGTPGYSWSIVSGSLPAGVSLQANGGIAGQISSAGTFPLVVKVTDGAGVSVSASFTLVVTAPTVVKAPLSITTTSLPQAVQCILFVACPQLFYWAPLTATGGTPGYTWSLVSGTLPPGVSVQPNGAIVGQIWTTGSFPLTVKVTDSTGATASAGFTLVVVAPS